MSEDRNADLTFRPTVMAVTKFFTLLIVCIIPLRNASKIIHLVEIH
ncbi:MAG: hypothetical protein VXY53_02040 [Candidatus Thermoplasmatota archaeon]|nr:hypothetical protein [Candidatus Thermoplasmatota archaeon]